MKALQSPWILMSLALVLHLLGYVGALITHDWEMPVPKAPEVVEEPLTIENLLESRADAHNWFFKTAELDKFVEELREREVMIAEREIALENLQAHLTVEREELLKLKTEIERRHKALSDEIIVVRRNEMANLRTLANSYSNITPAAAVAIFEQMDDTLVIKIVSLMKADVVAKLLEELAKNGETNPAALRRAARLSEELRLHYKEN
jgi:flagellar motility protein MotE (MotC chaperone)